MFSIRTYLTLQFIFSYLPAFAGQRGRATRRNELIELSAATRHKAREVTEGRLCRWQVSSWGLRQSCWNWRGRVSCPSVGNPGDESCHEWRQDHDAEQSLHACVLECAGQTLDEMAQLNSNLGQHAGTKNNHTKQLAE
jgi:hypothetical protein